MSISSFVSGFPRVGQNREYKWAVEKFWRGELSEEDLLEIVDNQILDSWLKQQSFFIDKQLIGDFSFYDQVLDAIAHLGIPLKRFGHISINNLQTYFSAARGGNVNGKKEQPLEMTKWFNTNYHYLVPEIDWDKPFEPDISRFVHEYNLATKNKTNVIAKILGPATLATLSKEEEFSKEQASKIVNAYLDLINQINEIGVSEIMLDEGAVAVGKHFVKNSHFESLIDVINSSNIDVRINGYFGSYKGFLNDLLNSEISTLHLDIIDGNFILDEIIEISRKKKISIGIVNGRSIWRNNLKETYTYLDKLKNKIDCFEISTSCSLMHLPYSLEKEEGLDRNLKSILSFGDEKLNEIFLLKESLSSTGTSSGLDQYTDNLTKANQDLEGRIVKEVRERVDNLTDNMFTRGTGREERLDLQIDKIGIPNLPTTTIGSFPQTAETRVLRKQLKSGEIDIDKYVKGIKEIIKETVEIQESLGLDVLVHGEAERNDMVEYFGELLNGFAFTSNGWVQSYGSRCVKPPIIYGDVFRESKMTVDWSTYAQSLTSKPMKGMLTGPVTILKWSFVRDDISNREVAYQIALALRDEVKDLESSGIKIIQIDEPAIREGLPLIQEDKNDYLFWAVNSFKLCSSGVMPETQIHSHMCYSEFDEILDAINSLDVDVLSIEASRSGMDLVNNSLSKKYSGAIGPGVYDIHSPLVLEYKDAKKRINQLNSNLGEKYIWINPDCGLKTRGWDEVKQSLTNMVKATIETRGEEIE
ncbi:MAG: 5-methyltetrahydropteroyltriglutamate--homocysteine S-methyltransferase [Actinomycetota bacterium]|nr:5-methyltetrahydropteroyltriglutamate--homocysteine S-methyltransferase [Actinomycetota bacterium]